MPILWIYSDKQAIYDKAEYMMRRHGYWLALYHCLTLQYHCARIVNDDNAKFWSAVYSLIKRDWGIRI